MSFKVRWSAKFLPSSPRKNKRGLGNLFKMFSKKSEEQSPKRYAQKCPRCNSTAPCHHIRALELVQNDQILESPKRRYRLQIDEKIAKGGQGLICKGKILNLENDEKILMRVMPPVFHFDGRKKIKCHFIDKSDCIVKFYHCEKYSNITIHDMYFTELRILQRMKKMKKQLFPMIYFTDYMEKKVYSLEKKKLKWGKAKEIEEIVRVPYIVMENCGIDLDELLTLQRRNNPKVEHPGLPWLFLARIVPHLLEQINVLHKMGYIHKSIKPKNIMFKNPNKVTLIDFSRSKRLRDIDILDSFVDGNIFFTSLNVFRHQIYTRKDDMISLAYTIVYLKNGFLPWTERNVYDSIKKFEEEFSMKLSERQHRKVVIKKEVKRRMKTASWDELMEGYPKEFKAMIMNLLELKDDKSLSKSVLFCKKCCYDWLQKQKKK